LVSSREPFIARRGGRCQGPFQISDRGL
jgi:hypothetical protein